MLAAERRAFCTAPLALLLVCMAAGPVLGDDASPPLPRSPWDHRAPPLYLDHVAQRLALTRAERDLLRRQGLVVLDRSLADSYAGTFHEIFQSQLPVYVSMDALFHAVYASHDHMLASLEQRRLRPLLSGILDRLRKVLPTAGYPPEITQDLDLYLAVPTGLLGAGSKGASTGPAAALLSAALQATEMKDIELFGRPRRVDFTQYTPRGHYTDSPELGAYFRAVMWLSRLEFNLVSRSCRSSAPGPVPDPRQTPREVADALALSDLVQRAGVVADLDALERAFALLAGPREDVSPADLRTLRAQAGLAGPSSQDPAAAADRLRAAIGDRFQRTANLHYMPEGTAALPVIATLLGARVVADTTALDPLVHDRVPGRHMVSLADIAYLLGQDRARVYLADDLRAYPSLDGQLRKTRERLSRVPVGADLYGAWLGAIRALAAPAGGVVPSFLETPAFADLRINTVAAAFGQLRHNNVLLAGQQYEYGGCEIPDGFVEPAPAVLDALISYAERGGQALSHFDPRDESGGRATLARMKRVLGVLRAVVAEELTGRPLSAESRRYLSMVSEITPGTTGSDPTYTGWYFDLFPSVETGLRRAGFIADYYTSVAEGRVAYAGAGAPEVGIFVVDVGGGPRVMVGPVASAYQHTGPLAKRLTDEDAQALPARTRLAPWARSYRPAAPDPPSQLKVEYDAEKRQVVFTSARALGPVAVELLDHHRTPIALARGSIAAGKTVIGIARPKGAALEGLGVRLGEFYQVFETNPVEGRLGGSIGREPAP